MSLLQSLKSTKEKSDKRIGRGYGSGKGGHNSSRGTKGQKARTKNVPLWFEGGQLPMIKRVPMWRGKGRLKALKPSVTVTLSDLDQLGADVITLDSLKLAKVVSKKCSRAKIIATGSVKRKLTIQGLKVSQEARKRIEAAGGTVAE